MPRATRVGDMNTGHDACPATALTIGSPNVFINKKSAGRVGDQYNPHACIDHAAHQDHIAVGSATVSINSIPASRVGDAVSIGGTVAEGSTDVFIGD